MGEFQEVVDKSTISLKSELFNEFLVIGYSYDYKLMLIQGTLDSQTT